MEHLLDTVIEYVRRKHAAGTAWYAWEFNPAKVPSGILPHGAQGSDWYSRNADLKRRLHGAWLEGSTTERAALEAYYIKGWGRVRGNRHGTLQAYHGASADENIARGKSGIASWSKALCVRNPLEYAIFDARVAASLNALQIIHRARIGVPARFPVLASQNRRVVQANRQLRSHFRAHGWPPERADFYRGYLSLCRQAAARLGGPGEPLPIYAVEMVLFAHTEELLREAFQEAAQT